MLKFFNANNKSSLKNLELILNMRKSKQLSQSSRVKKIISDVKKYGDIAVIKYEKKYSKIKIKKYYFFLKRDKFNIKKYK